MDFTDRLERRTSSYLHETGKEVCFADEFLRSRSPSSCDGTEIISDENFDCI